MNTIHKKIPIRLIGATAVVLGLGVACEPSPPPPPPVAFSWAPSSPLEGHLFVVRLGVTPPHQAVSVTGEVGGETLHFTTAGDGFESVAPVPVGTRGSIEALIEVAFEDGRSFADTLRIPVTATEYDHETLSVAPRFGSPLSPEDQALLDQDRAKATRAAAEAMATPRLWSESMTMPRASRVTSEFGTGRIFNGQISSRHMGLDLRGATGDTVLAVADGVVAVSDGFLLAGNVVYLNHGAGVISGYFHLSEQLVAEGDTVTAGTPIGRVGTTGRVTGPHLHWVVRYGTTSLDPRSLLTVRNTPSVAIKHAPVDASIVDDLEMTVPGDTVTMWDGSHGYSVDTGGGSVHVIDLLNDETDAVVEVCPNPVSGALTPDQTTYVVACQEPAEAVFINTASFRILGRSDGVLVDDPSSVAVPSPGHYALIGGSEGMVSVVDLETGFAVQTLVLRDLPLTEEAQADRTEETVGHNLGQVAFGLHSASGRVFASNPGGGWVEVATGSADTAATAADTPTEVVMLGVIHSGHEESEMYGLDVVERLVRAIDPDYWLTEIPPNRWERARREYEETGIVEEPRVRRFPEYIDVLFPLSREMDFEVIPTAGWTEPMSDFRASFFAAVAQDPERADLWAEYQAASTASREALAAGGASDDPWWIHTDAYDEAYDIRMQVYARLFDHSLGPGGWDAINASHWANIEQALDRHRGEGARMLITYGAGHKGPFLRELRKREDIVLLDVTTFLSDADR